MSVLLQTQGIHHITLNGADRKTSIDFWQDILGCLLYTSDAADETEGV